MFVSQVNTNPLSPSSLSHTYTAKNVSFITLYIPQQNNFTIIFYAFAYGKKRNCRVAKSKVTNRGGWMGEDMGDALRLPLKSVQSVEL